MPLSSSIFEKRSSDWKRSSETLSHFRRSFCIRMIFFCFFAAAASSCFFFFVAISARRTAGSSSLYREPSARSSSLTPRPGITSSLTESQSSSKSLFPVSLASFLTWSRNETKALRSPSEAPPLESPVLPPKPMLSESSASPKVLQMSETYRAMFNKSITRTPSPLPLLMYLLVLDTRAKMASMARGVSKLSQRLECTADLHTLSSSLSFCSSSCQF
mmetsp:Transcript_4294/g.13017  ORF Transcript_4294/g.13017 Transcript_4294/m.13017 type:complete len:217 (-) Transcript_4294:1662-2312(-)